MFIQLNYKLYFRVDIALDSISNIPGVAELVDAPDSRSGAEWRAGSSPLPGTFFRSFLTNQLLKFVSFA